VVEALQVWRLFPTLIEAELKHHYPGCSIGQWHRGEMTSRELLVLLRELPDDSKWKERIERTYRVVEKLEGPNKGQLFLRPALGEPEPGVEVIAEYVDWPFDRKLLARNTSEIASMRADGRDYDPDMTGLIEPLRKILDDHESQREARRVSRARRHIDAGLLGF
jgi:hypothetical protein